MGKKSKPYKRPRKLIHDMPRILLRLPEDHARWVDETAAACGLSRDEFFRQMVNAYRVSFNALNVDGSPESLFMRRLEDRLLEATEKAVRESMPLHLAKAAASVPPFEPTKGGAL